MGCRGLEAPCRSGVRVQRGRRILESLRILGGLLKLRSLGLRGVRFLGLAFEGKLCDSERYARIWGFFGEIWINNGKINRLIFWKWNGIVKD